MSKMNELMEWLENNEDDMDGPTCDAVYDKARQLLAEEEAEKATAPASLVEGLEAWENEAEAFYKATGYLRPGKDPGIIGDGGYTQRRDKAWLIWCGGWNYRDTLSRHTEAKQDEPLAVLADRKGFKGVVFERSNDGAIGPREYYCSPFTSLPDGGNEWFDSPTYAGAESKARAYLNTLPDKGETK